MKRVFDDHGGARPPTDPFILQRLIPKQKMRERIERLRQDLADPAIRPVLATDLRSEIARLERDLPLAEERDAVQAGRPADCSCLGAGGRGPRTLRETEAVILEVYCGCPEGQDRCELDEQALVAERPAAGAK